MKKKYELFLTIIFLLFSCLEDDKSNSEELVFEKPSLSSSSGINITMYSKNSYDILLNFQAPCGYKKIVFNLTLGNLLPIKTPELNDTSGKITLRVVVEKIGEDILGIVLIDNCNQKSSINIYLSIKESVGYSGVLANYTFSSNANDNSGKENHGIVNGAILTEDRFGKRNSAYYFDGNDDYIIVPNKFFDIGNDEYTISGWFLINDVEISNQNILNTSPSYGLSVDWNNNESPFVVSFSLNDNPNLKNWNIVSSNGVLASVGENKWHHFLLYKNKNIWGLYIDGIGDSFFFNL